MSVRTMQVRITHKSAVDLEEQVETLAGRYFGACSIYEASMGVPKGIPDYAEDSTFCGNGSKAITGAEWEVDVTITSAS